jgi:hypothetical protein
VSAKLRKTTIARLIADQVANDHCTWEIDAQDLSMDMLRVWEKKCEGKPLVSGVHRSKRNQPLSTDRRFRIFAASATCCDAATEGAAGNEDRHVSCPTWDVRLATEWH